jgi:CRP-like cAMP-binding protein
MTFGVGVNKPKILAKVVLFSTLESEELKGLAELSSVRKVAGRKVVFAEGENGDEMFIVVSGSVTVHLASAQGKKIEMGRLGTGDMFGEISLFDGKQRSATIETLEASEFLVIRRDDFLGFLLNKPAVAIKLLGVLASRIRMTNTLIEETLAFNLPSKLAKLLLDLVKGYGKYTSKGVRINAQFSNGELAKMVGTSEKVLDEQLREWHEKGVITLRSGYINIPDTHELALLV